MKGKPLLPTLRTKKRYVVYEYISDKNITHNEIVNAVKNSFKECFGIFGLGKSGLMDTKIFDKNLKRGILKINHKYLDHLRTSMAMITDIDRNKVIIHTVGVSGILKKTKNKYMKNLSAK
jgi:ribonuclease P/MRP protein subunit POP5